MKLLSQLRNRIVCLTICVRPLRHATSSDCLVLHRGHCSVIITKGSSSIAAPQRRTIPRAVNTTIAQSLRETFRNLDRLADDVNKSRTPCNSGKSEPYRLLEILVLARTRARKGQVGAELQEICLSVFLRTYPEQLLLSNSPLTVC